MEMTMTPQERQMLADLFERVRTAGASPRDPEAESFIGDAVRAAPFSPYVLAQTTLVQQHALEAAAKRISELETRLSQSESAPAETSFLGNLGKSLFGGGSAAPPPPRPGYDASGYQRGAPPPDPAGYRQQGYAPPPPAGPWGGAPAAPSAGGGFLSSAVSTAAGVAGGIAVADMFQNLLGGRGGGGLFGGRSEGFGGSGGGETINNFYEGRDPAGQHAEDVLQDQDQDQDDEQDANWDDSGSDDQGSSDT
jgi:hypothetical protein